MLTVLANQLPCNMEFFMNKEILSDLNGLYEKQTLPYIQGETICEDIAEFACRNITNNANQME